MSDKNHYEFEDRHISSIYESAKSEQPSSDVDAAILSASRRAVRSRPRTLSPFSGRWQIPSALAASLVLAVIIIPGLYDESMQVADPLLDKPVPMEALIHTDTSTRGTASSTVSGSAKGVTPTQKKSKRESSQANERVYLPRDSSPEPGTTHQLKMMPSAAPIQSEEAQLPQAPGDKEPLTPQKQAAPAVQQQFNATPPRRQRQELDPQLVEAWLREIRTLASRGETQEAVRQLRQLLRVHPEIRLPEDLAILLQP